MSRALLIVKIAVTVVLLGMVLAAADLSALARHLSDASIGYFAAAVLALVVQTFVLAARFRVIVGALGQPISARFAIELSFVGVLFNQALPSAIGGDAIRAWRLRGDGRPWQEAVNAVLLDRGSGVLVLAVLTAAAVTIESAALAPLRLWLWAVVAAGVAGVVVVAAADRLPLPQGLRRLLVASGLPAGFRTVFGTRIAPSAAAWSAASHLLAALAVYWLAVAFGVEVGLGAFLAAALSMLLAMMIPLSYAGWGIREVGAVWLFAQLGITAEIALAISVLFGAALFVASLPGLVFWFAPSLDRRSSARVPARPPRV
jgi:uncharacterized membrane protein YbhN (UPF0104 family)